MPRRVCPAGACPSRTEAAHKGSRAQCAAQRLALDASALRGTPGNGRVQAGTAGNIAIRDVLCAALGGGVVQARLCRQQKASWRRGARADARDPKGAEMGFPPIEQPPNGINRFARKGSPRKGGKPWGAWGARLGGKPRRRRDAFLGQTGGRKVPKPSRAAAATSGQTDAAELPLLFCRNVRGCRAPV